MSNIFIPRAYQTPAIDFIIDTPRCGLFADCGLGKTAAALLAHDYLALSGMETKPALVLGTLRIAQSVWKEEPPKWTEMKHIEVSTIVGDPNQRRAALRNKNAQIFTCNYEQVVWLLEELKDKWPFGMVIADESTRLKGLRVSTREKNGKTWIQGQGTLRARKLAKMAWINREGRWLNLSGTPSPNGLKDLYGQIWFQDFGKALGRSYTAFIDRWFKTGYDGYSIEPLPHAEREIHDAIKHMCMSIEAKDYFDLEKPIEIPVRVDLPPKARALYRDMEKDFFAKIGSRSAEALNAAGKNTKLMQLADGAVYIDPDIENDENPKAKQWREVHDAKLQALDGIIEESSGATFLIAYQFRSDRERLQEYFPKMRFLDSKKDEDDFKKGKIRLLGAHPASAGHGIDGFQKVCHRIVFMGHSWDAELRDQIIGRIGPVRQFQMGYKRPVYIYDIIAIDTIDEEICERHVEKITVQDALKRAMSRRGRSA